MPKEVNVDERKIQKIIQNYFDKGLLGRYDSSNNLFVGKDENTRENIKSNNNDSGKQQGRRKNLSDVNETTKGLDNSSFSLEKQLTEIKNKYRNYDKKKNKSTGKIPQSSSMR